MNNRVCQWIVRQLGDSRVRHAPFCVVLLHITSLHHKGLTTDEPVHYQYGNRVLQSSPRRTGALDSSTMPFSGLHATTSQLLAIIGNTSGFSVDTSWVAQIKRGRYATIILSLFLALYVFVWSYQLYGRQGALLSLSLYVFDPNFLAHGQLVTADLPAALMITIALYYFWQFLKLGGKARALLSATTLGLSQLAKYSCVYLYPIFLVTGVIYRRSMTAAEAGHVQLAPQADLLGTPLVPCYSVVCRGKYPRNQSWIWVRWLRNAIVEIHIQGCFLQNGPGDANHC